MPTLERLLVEIGIVWFVCCVVFE